MNTSGSVTVVFGRVISLLDLLKSLLLWISAADQLGCRLHGCGKPRFQAVPRALPRCS